MAFRKKPAGKQQGRKGKPQSKAVRVTGLWVGQSGALSGRPTDENLNALLDLIDKNKSIRFVVFENEKEQESWPDYSLVAYPGDDDQPQRNKQRKGGIKQDDTYDPDNDF